MDGGEGFTSTRTLWQCLYTVWLTMLILRGLLYRLDWRRLVAAGSLIPGMQYGSSIPGTSVGCPLSVLAETPARKDAGGACSAAVLRDVEYWCYFLF